MVIRNRRDGTEPNFELGRKSISFETWPDQIYLMATRKWPNIMIDGVVYETQTSFFSGNMTELYHQMTACFFTTVNTSEFTDWLATVGTKFARDEITADWLNAQSLNHDLFQRFQITMVGITTFASTCPGEQDERSVHLAFLLNGQMSSEQSVETQVASSGNPEN